MNSGEINGKAIIKLNGEYTTPCDVTPQDIISLMCGKRISNNYFKLHGGIMRRKGRRRKKWKR